MDGAISQGAPWAHAETCSQYRPRQPRRMVEMSVSEVPVPVAEARADVVHAARSLVTCEGPGQYVAAFDELKDAVRRLDSAMSPNGEQAT